MKRALIVVDVQNEYVTGTLTICAPDLMTSSTRCTSDTASARSDGARVPRAVNAA